MSEKATVLLVDDEPELTEILSFDMEEAGYETLQASNGKEAFEIIQQNKVDVVVTDVRMPGGGGIELLKSIKSLQDVSPVVLFVTAFADISVQDAYDKGAEALFSKPVDPDALLEVIQKALTPKAEKWVREAERASTSLEVNLKLSKWEEAVQSQVINIGRGGLFISLDKEIPNIGDKISFNLLFDDPAWGPIKGTGLVRWVRKHTEENLPAGFGIEFVSLEGGCSDRIASLINGIKTNAYIPKS